MRWYLLPLFLLVCLATIGCLKTASYGTYTNNRYGFTLDPPQEWSIKENYSETEAVRFTPEQTNVTFSISPPIHLDQGLALSIFADQREETMPQQYTNYTTLYRDWRTIDGLNAYESISSYRENETMMKSLQVAVQKSQTVFLLTFTVPQPQYDKTLSLVNQSIDSFQII